MKKTLIYCILDGFGLSGRKDNNPFFEANIPTIKSLFNYPFTTLSADGSNVGQEDGLVGNSEVGHINLGGLKLINQLSYEITKSSQTYFENIADFDSQLFDPNDYLKNNITENDKIHLIGLFSKSSVHSDLRHLQSLISVALKTTAKNIVLHLISDGRDTNRQSFFGTLSDFWEDLETQNYNNIDQIRKRVVIGSIAGRYYTMDRDKNYDRVNDGLKPVILDDFSNIISANSENIFDKIKEYIDDSYNNEVFDEYIKPVKILTNNQDFTFKDSDLIIVTNFRSDRARQMTIQLLDYKKTKKDLKIITLADYGLIAPKEQNLANTLVSLFRQAPVSNTLSDYVNLLNKNQLNIAETEKYAHVTYFFDGGREIERLNQKRVLIPSNKVSSHAQKPEMKTAEVTDYIITKGLNKYDLIVVNYACSDMVGHTGDYPASIKALECLDENLGKLIEIVKSQNHTLIITADHGNIEVVGGHNNSFDTEHNPNPVPLIVINNNIDQILQSYNQSDVDTQQFYDSNELSKVIEELKKTSKMNFETGWFEKTQILTPKLKLFHAGIIVAYLLSLNS
jgi:2,3-bisphosphoglycerate-independent phosphoglycerate mutase